MHVFIHIEVIRQHKMKSLVVALQSFDLQQNIIGHLWGHILNSSYSSYVFGWPGGCCSPKTAWLLLDYKMLNSSLLQWKSVWMKLLLSVCSKLLGSIWCINLKDRFIDLFKYIYILSVEVLLTCYIISVWSSLRTMFIMALLSVAAAVSHFCPPHCVLVEVFWVSWTRQSRASETSLMAALTSHASSGDLKCHHPWPFTIQCDVPIKGICLGLLVQGRNAKIQLYCNEKTKSQMYTKKKKWLWECAQRGDKVWARQNPAHQYTEAAVPGAILDPYQSSL